MASKNEYADSLREAIYLEIGWSDFLLNPPADSTRAENEPYPNPLYDHVSPSFYQKSAALVEAWVRETALDLNSYCDIGGGPGRTVFEIGIKFPYLKQLVLAEPSSIFCNWARKLLTPVGEPPKIPTIITGRLPAWVEAYSWPTPMHEARNRISIVNKSVEELVTSEQFDLITCLNVVDRHPCPASVVSIISKHLNDKGLLIMSSPMDFLTDITPTQQWWFDDLNTLFSNTDCWSHVGQAELFYEYRTSGRSWTRLCSQVVAKQFHATRDS